MSELYNDAQYTAMAWNATMLKSGPDRNTSIPYNRKHQITPMFINPWTSTLAKRVAKKTRESKQGIHNGCSRLTCNGHGFLLSLG